MQSAPCGKKSCGHSEGGRTALGGYLEEGTFKSRWRTVRLGPADRLPDKHPRLAPSPPPSLCCHVILSLRPPLTTPLQPNHQPFPAANTLYGLLTHHVHGLCSHPKEIGAGRSSTHSLAKPSKSSSHRWARWQRREEMVTWYRLDFREFAKKPGDHLSLKETCPRKKHC